MILHELKALALREGLVDDPAFESKPVRWVIVLDEDGGYQSMRDTLQDVPLKEGQAEATGVYVRHSSAGDSKR